MADLLQVALSQQTLTCSTLSIVTNKATDGLRKMPMQCLIDYLESEWNKSEQTIATMALTA
ncbi:hypothetical protein [Bacteroides fragilis]|uniref:hypothetical protein n=1 Tax=Bacteroides fragilis TaxID=817 RepID=UPI0010563D46|nr:hypothetical protein [Bacteroides fragilis]